MTVEELLTELSIPYEHEKSGWVNCLCPDCGRFPYLGINMNKVYSFCWSCGYRSLYEVLLKLSQEPAEVGRLLKECRNSLPNACRIDKTGARIDPEGKSGVRPASHSGIVLGPLLPVHIRYLNKRRLNCTQVQNLWQIQGIGASPRLPWRIYIPVHYRDREVSWITRSLTEDEPRYCGAAAHEESIPRKWILYGADKARNSVIVTEGIFDCWAIGPGAVATMGVGYSQGQLLRVATYPVRFIAFDQDQAGQQRAQKLCDELSCWPGRTVQVELSHGKDPASTSRKELEQLRRLIRE